MLQKAFRCIVCPSKFDSISQMSLHAHGQATVYVFQAAKILRLIVFSNINLTKKLDYYSKKVILGPTLILAQIIKKVKCQSHRVHVGRRQFVL